MNKEEKEKRIQECKDEIEKLGQEIKKLEKEEYPIVKITLEGLIVLFTAPKTGIKINGIRWPMGVGIGWSWVEKDFKPFTGTIEYKDGLPVAKGEI